MLGTILIIILILLLIGALPTWPYSTDWGYYPGGGLGLILIIVLVLSSRRPIVTERSAAAGRSAAISLTGRCRFGEIDWHTKRR
jgi:hypothetical protein